MSKKILIVEDELAIVFVLQRVFEDMANWETRAANSGKEALELVSAENFDAMILDLSLPEMEGLELIDRIRANPQTASLPIVLLTAKVMSSDRSRFSSLPISGVIAKPFEPLTVWREVAQLLGWEVP